jgi:cell division protein ZapA
VANESDRKTVRVTIFNQSYSLLASDEPGEVENLAHYVDELMMSIASRGGNVDTARTAVLACLHMADKIATIEKEFNALKARIETRSGELSKMLDHVVE